MKLKLTRALIILIIAMEVLVPTAFSEDAEIEIYLDQERIESDVAPFIEHDRVMVPLRFVAEELGATVFWRGTEQKIEVYKPNIRIVFTIGFQGMELNKKLIAIDAEPVLRDDRTFVPLRAITECFGIKTDWDAEKYAVYLDSETIEKPIEEKLAFGSRFGRIFKPIYDDYLKGVYGEELFVLGKAAVDQSYNKTILVYKKDGVITVAHYDATEQVLLNTISEEEFEAFSAFMEENNVDALADWDSYMVWDGSENQYMHCKGDRAVSFYMNNPSDAENELYNEFIEKFEDLQDQEQRKAYMER